MAVIRKATADDYPGLIWLGRMMHQESPRYSRMTFSDAKCENLISRLTQSSMGLVLVAHEGREMVGMLGGVVMPYFFSDDLLAQELVVYVRPECRGGTTAVKLVRHFENWATSKGASEIQMGVTTGVHTDRTADFYEAMDFSRVGVLLSKRCT